MISAKVAMLHAYAIDCIRFHFFPLQVPWLANDAVSTHDNTDCYQPYISKDPCHYSFSIIYICTLIRHNSVFSELALFLYHERDTLENTYTLFYTDIYLRSYAAYEQKT